MGRRSRWWRSATRLLGSRSTLGGQLKKKGLWSPEEEAIFLPIGVPAIECAAAAPVSATSVSVELGLAKGRTLRFDSVMDEATLMRLIRAVEAA